MFTGKQNATTRGNVESTETSLALFCGGNQSRYYTTGSGDHYYNAIASNYSTTDSSLVTSIVCPP